MKFANRTIAGRQLGEILDRFFSSPSGSDKKSDIVVVGLPRGGVPVALEVARKLGCPLEIIVAKKLPFPGQPEYAIGAVSSDGIIVLNPDIPPEREWTAYIEEQRQRLLEHTMRIESDFYDLAGRKPSSLKDKTVVVVDDGIATGMTAFAALASVRQRGAKYTIMAAPVMSSESYRELGSHCDHIVSISVPEMFRSVGQHYEDFRQTTNDEVVSALSESALFNHLSHSPTESNRLTDNTNWRPT